MRTVAVRILTRCVASLGILSCTNSCKADLVISDAQFAHDFETISGTAITGLQGPIATATSDAIANSTSPAGFGSTQHMRAVGGSAFPRVDTNTRLTSSTSGLSFSMFYNDRGDNGGEAGPNVARLLTSYSGPGAPRSAP